MIVIRSDREIELMKHAGHINYLAHKEVAKHLKVGVSTSKLNKIADKFIRDNDCIPSFLNYEGYPASICISINDEVVHGIPSSRVIKDGDVVSIDIGVCYKGYHSDSANTYIVGKQTKEVEDLVNNTKNALYEGLSAIKKGVLLSDIGMKIEDYAKRNNLGVIEELVGHGVGTSIHEEPDVPNYYVKTNIRLKKGMVLAIEPMLTLGKRYIYMEDDDWTIKTEDGLPSAHFEHTIVVTDNGYEILTGE